MASIRAKFRAVTDRRYVGFAVEVIVGNLNRVLRGWSAYFRYGNSARKFEAIDCYVHEHLAKFASTKHGKHGLNLGTYNWEWINHLKVYRLEGKTRWGTAHAWR